MGKRKTKKTKKSAKTAHRKILREKDRTSPLKNTQAGSQILSVQDLVCGFDTESGYTRVVQSVSFSVNKGEVLGIVGESGCGKSVTALSVLRLLPKPSGKIESGSIFFEGQNLLALPVSEMQEIRGRRISMIFQEPMTALNPVHRIGKQLQEVYKLHFPDMQDDEILEESIHTLRKVGIPAPEKRIREYPHQISGGMRQRVMIAMALSTSPALLIADEPTTALDVTIQAEILDTIVQLQKAYEMAVLFITHDLGVIARLCHRVVVMYAGKIVEEAPVTQIFNSPAHPYTKGLLSSIPRLGSNRKEKLDTIKGMVPPMNALPKGCSFENRCPRAEGICREKQPEMISLDRGHSARCFFAKKI